MADHEKVQDLIRRLKASQARKGFCFYDVQDALLLLLEGLEAKSKFKEAEVGK